MNKWNEHEWDNLQHVNINSNKAFCNECGIDLLDIDNFIYLEKIIKKPLYWEELCQCKCKTSFVLHYDIFDNKGHIYPRIFSEDVNNPDYNWQETLNDEQKKVISNHLLICQTCRDRLSDEILTDAWFRGFLKELRARNG